VKVTTPLYLKFWLWLALNLLLLAGLLLVVASRDGPGWRMLLTEAVRDRLVTIGADIGQVLAGTPQDQWPKTLFQLGKLHGVSFEIGGTPRDGRQRAGSGLDLKSPRPQLAGEIGESVRQVPPDSTGTGERRMRAELITLRGGFVGPFQVTIPASIEESGQAPLLYDLRATAGDLFSLLGFLGVQNWVLYPLLALGLSALWWLPFVWNITRSVTHMTQTTARIADGDFDARIVAERRDELGQLAASVNKMAVRLGGQLAEQKQFLADVAHDITSPLARLRVALGLLGASPPGTLSEQTLQDMHDDLQLMADMLNDLLLFSQADVRAQKRALEPVHLLATATAALEREGAIDRVLTRVEPELHALAVPALFDRALAHLLRNALRHAGEGRPIEIAAQRVGERALLQVRDRGPGVPDGTLTRLGEPFFRVENSRGRAGAGFGLGLAIVRRCVEACEGEVEFRNRDGGGFEAEIRLRSGASRLH
jgi:two-component system sensor histidine kinase CpxA